MTRPNLKIVRPGQQTKPKAIAGINLELVAIIAVATITGAFSINSYLSPASVARREGKRAHQIAQTNHELRLAEVERESAFADRRYLGGCTLLAQEFAPQRFRAIALSDAVAIADIHTGGKLSPGDIICDDNGQSAEVGPDGKATDFYRSYDTALVNTRVDDAYGWAKEFVRSSPGQAIAQ